MVSLEVMQSLSLLLFLPFLSPLLSSLPYYLLKLHP